MKLNNGNDKKLNEEISEDSMEETMEDENPLEIIEEKQKEIDEIKDRYLRLQADFINYRNRTEKEKERSISYGIEKILCEILPIVDNFERAMESEMDKDNGFYKGIEMIQDQLIKAIKANGVEEINPLGEEFDPNLHHAVLMEESEEYDSGKIINVLQKGYVLNDKIIRPSMVIVSK